MFHAFVSCLSTGPTMILESKLSFSRTSWDVWMTHSWSHFSIQVLLPEEALEAAPGMMRGILHWRNKRGPSQPERPRTGGSWCVISQILHGTDTYESLPLSLSLVYIYI